MSKRSRQQKRRSRLAEARKAQADPVKADLLGLRINEISAVGTPAQEGARALLMKVAPEEKAPLHPLLKGRFAEALRQEEVGETIYALMDETWTLNHALRQAVETAIADNPDDPTESIKDILAEYSAAFLQLIEDNRAAITDAAEDTDAEDGGKVTKRGDAPPEDDPMPNKPTDTGAPTTEELTKQLEERDATIATLKAEGALTDAEKTHYGTLEGDAKEAFLKMSPGERSATLEAIAKQFQDADPVIYTTDTGIELRKSFGEAQIALAKDLDIERRERVRLQMEKRAQAELSHLTGDQSGKIALLKAIDTLPADEQDAAMAIVKATDAGVSKAMDTLGVDSGGDATDDPVAKLNKMAEAHAAEHGVTHAAAFAAVLATPEGSELYTASQTSN